MDMGAPDEALDRPARKIRPRSRWSFASALSVGLSAAGILAAYGCLTPAWSDASIKYCADKILCARHGENAVRRTTSFALSGAKCGDERPRISLTLNPGYDCYLTRL
jgi:hypothetical protein